jgi:hypothetical protein
MQSTRLDQKEDAARAYKYNYLSPIHPTLDSRMSLGHASFPDIHTSATNIFFPLDVIAFPTCPLFTQINHS